MALNDVLNRPLFRQQALKKGAQAIGAKGLAKELTGKAGQATLGQLAGNVVIINQKSKLLGSKGMTNLKTGVSNIVGDRKNKKRVRGTFSPIKKQNKGD